jgi:glycosyltransferase involved in cell wall biosynthesis
MKPVIGAFMLYYMPEPLGGAERSTHNYFKRLSKYYDIHVTCFMHGDRKFFQKDDLVVDGIHIIRTPQPIDMAVRSFIVNYKPDMIVTQLLGSDIVVNESYKYDVPCVFFAHGVFEDICLGGIRRDCPYTDVMTCDIKGPNCTYSLNIDRNLEKYKKCESIICNSKFMIDCFKRFYPEVSEKIKLSCPDFDYDLFQYSDKRPSDKIRILAVNSSVLKGRDLIFDIAYRNQDLEVIYVDVRQPDHNFLVRSPNIRILGKVSREEMSELYKEANVTIIPTVLQETFSGVACESILSGTPVLCTPKGNLTDLVKDKGGKLIDSLNYEDWIDYIRIFSKSVINEKYSNFVREKLNCEKNSEDMKELFDSILKEKQLNNFIIDKENFIKVGDKKIMFLARFFYPPLGGGEYFIHNVLSYLIKMGYNCEAACYCHPDPRIKMKECVTDWRGIKTHQFSSISYEKIYNFLKKEKPDLVITQSYDAPDIVSAAKSLGIKTILGTHFWRNICEVEDNFVNMLTRPLNTVKIRKDLHRVFREADELYVNSEYMKRAVKRYVGVDIERIITPIIDRDRVISKEKDRKYITLINPDVGKGGSLFVQLSKNMTTNQFMCVGLGNDFLPENRIINENIKKQPNIIKVQNTDKMSEIYKVTKVLLIPSIVDETFSMVALEAMANGIPVLASNFGNLPYLLGEDCELILDPFDLFCWEEKIKELYSNDSYYSKCSEGMIRKAKMFDPDRQLELFFGMVQKCIGV